MNLLGLEFVEACRNGNRKEVKRLCSLNVDINSRNWDRHTGLYLACFHNEKRTVRFLLKQPALEVNSPDRQGLTPFCLLCYLGFSELVQIFLLDARVDVKRADISGHTPLWTACQHQHLETVKMLLASGRDLDFGRSDDRGVTALDVARTRSRRIVQVMQAYEADPRGTRRNLRRELNWFTPEALLLALIVFLSDGLLSLSEYPLKDRRRRFFKIASVLPFELQMVLVNRGHRLATVLIPFEDRESGFRYAARMYFRKQRTK